MLGTLTPYVDDTAHVAEPDLDDGFVIVMDPTGLFWRGLQFERQDFEQSLYRCSWPLGMVVRDRRDNMRYVVADEPPRGAGTRGAGAAKPHQMLVSICGRVELIAVDNKGTIERRER